MRVITTQTQVFVYKELSEEAKERARQWYIETFYMSYPWWFPIFQEARQLGLLITDFGLGEPSFIQAALQLAENESAEIIMKKYGKKTDIFQAAFDYSLHLTSNFSTLLAKRKIFSQQLKSLFMRRLQQEFEKQRVEYHQSLKQSGIDGNLHEFTEDGKIFSEEKEIVP